MKNSIGNSVILTVFGESHGEAIGAVLDGLASGIEIDEAFISRQMEKRSGKASLSTSRREADKVKILSGVFEGKTTGTPIAFLIENENTRSGDYSKMKTIARPSHADYAAQLKYHGFQDYRGGGHFSGRITAGIVAAGSVCQDALRKKGIYIGTHILSCGGISDRHFDDFESDFKALDKSETPIITDEAKAKIEALIERKRSEGDSVGGILETAVTGLPGGVGEPWFSSIESELSRALFAIPAVKGVQFGAGFDLASMSGSEANDALYTDGKAIKTNTNNNGGINGGISNGMPIVFSLAVKPTPSIFMEQDTVDFASMTNEKLSLEGRHDPAIVHRAAVVVDSLTAIVLCDMLSLRFGTDYLAE